MNNDKKVRFISENKAAELLQVSISTIKNFIAKGIVRALKTPKGKFFVSRNDLATFSDMDSVGIRDQRSLLSILEEFLSALESHQQFCRTHSKTVAKISVKIAHSMGFSAKQMHRLYFAAMFHDIGLIRIKPEIVNKRQELSAHEYDIIKTHSVLGEQTLYSFPHIKNLAHIVRQHHERVDGRGYPDSVNRHKICEEAKIIALADAFACMTANDYYKEPFSVEAAINEIKNNAGTQFDLRVTDMFLKVKKDDVLQNTAA
ncbi:MAG: hypothetical protein COV72_00515 [Candidatus Omnitrophica bacterium CG11_big_fil_rev_8_21_14_0_20_42_13]|uniref:HD-GYP domain-containing protein n=1 Tax=Candidatus Ghiorseimicrobium undicola TaxID=1974746 RepID=A0A2H0LZZ3_9BACT|nr:MAG: hypothetical protein COV72_00515 [Candidatus Omnitrophica bacterium CG11_big_fil_rev_8_21_14_0_20_42_13]